MVIKIIVKLKKVEKLVEKSAEQNNIGGRERKEEGTNRRVRRREEKGKSKTKEEKNHCVNWC